MTKRYVFAVAALTLLYACSPPLAAPSPQPGPTPTVPTPPPTAPPTTEPPSLSEQDQIREVVFRYQFEHNVSGQKQAANSYYLEVEEGADPSPQLLAQFVGHHPPVQPVSASMLEAGTALVLDRETGLSGLIFRVDEIRWLGEDAVEVDGGYEEASESGSGNTYHVTRGEEDWQVVGMEPGFIK
jgi:hypothetical protein